MSTTRSISTILMLALLGYGSAASARFVQPDPLGVEGGVNLYAYVGNDPLNNTDPSGLICSTSGGNLSCTTPGGISFTVPAPTGFPASIAPGQANYHGYSVPVGPAPVAGPSLMQGVINRPTPGPSYLNSPATPQGTTNEATPGSLYGLFLGGTRQPAGAPLNPVKSYLTTDQNGNPVVVNVTLPGAALFPGYAARYTTSSPSGSTIQNEGEGLSAWQAPGNPVAPFINNVWQGQSQGIINDVMGRGVGGRPGK